MALLFEVLLLQLQISHLAMFTKPQHYLLNINKVPPLPLFWFSFYIGKAHYLKNFSKLHKPWLPSDYDSRFSKTSFSLMPSFCRPSVSCHFTTKQLNKMAYSYGSKWPSWNNSRLVENNQKVDLIESDNYYIQSNWIINQETPAGSSVPKYVKIWLAGHSYKTYKMLFVNQS